MISETKKGNLLPTHTHTELFILHNVLGGWVLKAIGLLFLSVVLIQSIEYTWVDNSSAKKENNYRLINSSTSYVRLEENIRFILIDIRNFVLRQRQNRINLKKISKMHQPECVALILSPSVISR